MGGGEGLHDNQNESRRSDAGPPGPSPIIASPFFLSPRSHPPAPSHPDPRLKNSYIFPKDGWTYVHLEGTPAEIGFQHGYLLAAEIEDHAQASSSSKSTHDTGQRLDLLPRRRRRQCSGPTSSPNTRRSCRASPTASRRAAASTLDIWDIVAINASLEWPTTTPGSTTSTHPGEPASHVARPTTAAPSSPPAATRKTARSSSPTTTGPLHWRRALERSSSTSRPRTATAS